MRQFRTPSARRREVLVFAGGGLSHVSGGVGTLMGYVMAVWDRDPASLPVRVVDTRGPGGALSAARHFASALLHLGASGLAGRVACVHVHMTTRGSAWRKSLICALARACGMPCVLHLHGADFFDFSERLAPVPRRLLRATIARADCVVVIGARWRDRLIGELGIPPDRVRVVTNGVPAATGRRRHMDAGGVPRILFLGRLGARKGVPELIAALASPTMAVRVWQATVAGDGGLADLRRSVAAAGLEGRVATPGWLDGEAAAGALDAADVLVLPSHHEVMPIAIPEAMARGLAIVATPVGAIPEILRDGTNALLVPPGDVAALSAALARLVDDPALRGRLGEAALRDFSARLEVGVPAAALQSIYRELAQRPLAAAAA